MKKNFLKFSLLLFLLLLYYVSFNQTENPIVNVIHIAENADTGTASAGEGSESSGLNIVIEYAGRLSGIFGVLFLGLLIFIGGGSRLLDKWIGLPAVIHLHKWFALFTLAVILIHPIALYILKYYSSSSFSDFAYFAGPIALFITLLVVVSALIRKKFPYPLWIWIHRLSIPALGISVYHAFALSDWVKNYSFFRWIVILGAAIGIIGVLLRIITLFVKPVFRSHVLQIEENTDDVSDVIVQLPDGFRYKAGQFCIISFDRPGLKNPHPFTISSSPAEKNLVFTIKASGKFTSGIKGLKAGDKIKIRGPFGVFTYRGKPSTLIAGGVGVTPFRSILGNLKDEECPPVMLVYGSRTENNIIFRNWFTQNVPVQVVHVLSHEEKQGFLYGNINEDFLKSPAERGEDFYICGPPLMIKAVKKCLKKLGVSNRRIYSEKFFY